MSALTLRALLLLVLLSSLLPARADDKPTDSPWSPVVRGLRARAYTSPSKDAMVDKTYDIWIEFQEVGLDTSLGLQHRSLRVRFSRPEMDVAIGKKGGDPIAAVSRTVPTQDFAWDIVFPPGGDVAFPIGEGGSRPHVILGQTPPKGRLLSFDAGSEWTVPIDGGPYQLAITLDIPAKSSASTDPSATGATPAPHAVALPVPVDADAAHKPPYHGWTGTLVLPPINLPTQ